MITSDKIAIYTKFKVGTDFTETQFQEFLADAVDKFTTDDPGLTSRQADRAVALLVGHYIAMQKGLLDATQESWGSDYAVQKGPLGKSSYLVEYLRIVAPKEENVREIPSGNGGHCARSDANMGQFVRDHWRP